MITILSDDEQRKATVRESRGTCTITYYRWTGPGSLKPRWIYERCTESHFPLHLVLDSTHAVINRP